MGILNNEFLGHLNVYSKINKHQFTKCESIALFYKAMPLGLVWLVKYTIPIHLYHHSYQKPDCLTIRAMGFLCPPVPVMVMVIPYC